MDEPMDSEATAPGLLCGRVATGQGDAVRRLSRFNEAYRRKVGMPVFPGSLNVALTAPFDWFAPHLQPHILWFGREEYGGERDILLLSCILCNMAGQRAFLWTTTTAAHGRKDPPIVEVIAPVGLRATYGLRDGDVVMIELPVEGGDRPPAG